MSACCDCLGSMCTGFRVLSRLLGLGLTGFWGFSRLLGLGTTVKSCNTAFCLRQFMLHLAVFQLPKSVSVSSCNQFQSIIGSPIVEQAKQHAAVKGTKQLQKMSVCSSERNHRLLPLQVVCLPLISAAARASDQSQQ